VSFTRLGKAEGVDSSGNARVTDPCGTEESLTGRNGVCVTPEPSSLVLLIPSGLLLIAWRLLAAA
jgi:hypothetical protein